MKISKPFFPVPGRLKPDQVLDTVDLLPPLSSTAVLSQCGRSIKAVIGLFVAVVMLSTGLSAQAFISHSGYFGGNNETEAISMKVVNGETYFLGATKATDYPVTDGSVLKTDANGPTYDYVVTKLDVNGNIVYATYLGSSWDEEADNATLAVENGEVYILGQTDGDDYPVLNGLPYNGGDDAVLTKLDVDGNIVYSTYLGRTDRPDSDEEPSVLRVENGMAYVTGITDPGGFGPGSSNDVFLFKINPDGSIAYLKLIGGDQEITFDGTIRDGGGDEDEVSMAISNGEVYLFGLTNAVDFPVTDGSTLAGRRDDFFVAKLDNAGDIIYASYLGGSEDEDHLFINTTPPLQVVNGELYVFGLSQSIDFPTPNGNSIPTDDNYFVVAKFDAAGNQVFGTSFGSSDRSIFPGSYIVQDGVIYIANRISGDATGYPVTDGIPAPTNGDNLVVTKLDANTGSLLFSSFIFGGQNNDNPGPADLQVEDGYMYVYGVVDENPLPTTNGSTPNGDNDVFIVKLDPSGKIVYSSYIGGSEEERYEIDGKYADVSQLQVENGNIYFITETVSNDYPVTNSSTITDENRTIAITKLSFCSGYTPPPLTVTPATQTVCQFGLAAEIEAPPIVVPGGDLPTVFRNGAVSEQDGIQVKYQWQSADDPAGPWTDIPAGILPGYLASVGATDQYYRRKAFVPCCDVEYISEVAAILVNENVAPTVSGEPVRFTCSDVPVTIGGDPTATPGSSPITSYLWDMDGVLDDETLPNPVATVMDQTIFTVTVTDQNNCQQIGQTVVLPVEADAGPNVDACEGVGIRIGTLPPPGLTGVIYSWSTVSGDDAATSLSCTDCAQPIASPSTVTTYEVSMTIPLFGGGSCSTTDQVTVSPVLPPRDNFAGEDMIICLGETTELGTPQEDGFSYTWAPGNYLRRNDRAEVTFEAGNLSMPVPNPITYFVTAEKAGCTFVDQVQVSVIEADADIDGCGPRTIGTPDRTPNLNETYSWELVSGPGGFTGPTNVPVTTVSASVGGTSIYRLTVTLDGVECVDEVVVPDCGCQVDIEVSDPNNCPSFFANGGDPITLTASAADIFGDPDNFIYTWSPAAGLSTTVGRTVELTDNVNRTYTVTMTSPFDPNFSCSESIEVNNPDWSLPVFEAQDGEICELNPTPVEIGQPMVAEYAYAWTGPDGFTSDMSNPSVTEAGAYTVTVTDIGSGCTVEDVATVNEVVVVADAGPDWEVCDNAIIQLGTPDLGLGYTYMWDPEDSPWRNGTDETSDQPEVLITTDLTFMVTVTDPVTGCFSTDEVMVTVNNTPTLEPQDDKTVCEGGSVQIGGYEALPGVVWSWSPTNDLSCTDCPNPMASPTTTTSYTVTATYLGQCQVAATDEITVTVQGFSFDLGEDLTYCPSDGPINIGENAPVGNFSYTWSPRDFLSSRSVANPEADPPLPTTYSLRVRQRSSPFCTFTDEITVIPSELSPDAGTDKTICLEGSTVLGNPNNTGTLVWSGPAAGDLSCTECSTPTFTPTSAGEFTFTLTRTVEGCTTTDEITVFVQELVLPDFPSSEAICQDACVEIGPEPEFGVSYVWSPQAGLEDPFSARTLACPDGPTTYILTAINSLGCVATSSVTVSFSQETAPTVSVPDETICIGSSTSFNPVVSPTGNYDYIWSPAVGLDNPNVANPTVFGSRLGTNSYSLLVVDNGTGCQTTAQAELEVVGADVISLSINEADCYGAEVALSATVTGEVAGVSWISSGDGTFSPSAAVMDPVYIPGPNDRASASVEIELQAFGANCGNVVSTSTIIEPCVAVGNYVFMDTNDNGIFESGTDMPIGGVVVELYTAGANPGVDVALAMTTTNGDGYYYFDGLPSGDYFVYIPASNFGLGQVLENKESYPGADVTDTSDGDDNGADAPVNGGIVSNTFTLTPNGEPVGEDQTDYPGVLDDNNVNGTIDFTFACIDFSATLDGPTEACVNSDPLNYVATPAPTAGNTGVFTTTAPAGLIDNGDGTATLDVIAAGSGTFEIRYTYTASSGCAATQALNVTIDDTEPPTALCQDITVEVDGMTGTVTIDPLQVNNMSTDNCGIASYELDRTDFSCEDEGDNPVVLTVTDVNGNPATCNATVTVEDNNVEFNYACIRNVNVTLDGECGATVTPEMVLSGALLQCVDEFIIDIDGTGTDQVDGCGDHIYEITVIEDGEEIYTCWGNIFAEDKTAPVVECPPNTDEVSVPWDAYVVSGALEESDASFAMNDFSCYSDIFDPEGGQQYYDVITFTVNVTGNYTFGTSGDFNPKAALYQGELDPDHFCDGIIAQNEGVVFGAGFILAESAGRFIFPLEAGQTYSYVVTTRFAEATGDWLVAIIGENPELTDDPDEPSEIEFAPSSEYSVTIESQPLETTLLCTDVNQILFPNVQRWIADANGAPNAAASIAAGFFRNPAEVQAFIDKMALTGIPVVGDNCGQMVVTLSDMLMENGDCGDIFINRTFRVVDRYQNCEGSFGNPMVDECVQRIDFRRPTVADVILPPFAAPLDCSADFETDGTVGGPDDNPAGTATGRPWLLTAFGIVDMDENICNIGANYSDEPRLVVCDGTYKFRREWNIIDWCEQGASTTYDQYIKVGDFRGPELVSIPGLTITPVAEGNDRIVVSTSPFDCVAYVRLPEPVLSDNCSPDGAYATYKITAAGGGVVATGRFGDGRTTQAPVTAPGQPHTLTVCSYDGCGNSWCDDYDLVVRDLIEPFASCDDQLNVSIGGGDIANGVQGIHRVYATDVDEGSSDNCGPVTLLVRREIADPFTYDCLDHFDYNGNGRIINDEISRDFNDFSNPGGWFTPWLPYADFTCCDVGVFDTSDDDILVELEVTDGAGNKNICWMYVEPEDKLRPYCYAPADDERSCVELPLNFPGDIEAAYNEDREGTVQMLNALFGAPTGTDNCRVDTIVENRPLTNLNDCGWGSITRRFEVWQLKPEGDANGNGRIDRDEVLWSTNDCRQTIRITETHEFVIDFPEDAAADCASPCLPEIEIMMPGCDNVLVNESEPQVFAASGDECYKLAITYDVINWCIWDGEYEGAVIKRRTENDGLQTGDRSVESSERPVLRIAGPNAGNLTVVLDRKHDRREDCNGVLASRFLDDSFFLDDELEDEAQDAYDDADNEDWRGILAAGRWQYTQFIKVYDETAPEVVNISYNRDEAVTALCTQDQVLEDWQFVDPYGTCDAEVNITFDVTDVCDGLDGAIDNITLIGSALDGFVVDENRDGEIKVNEFTADAIPFDLDTEDGVSYTFSGTFPIIEDARGDNVYHALQVVFEDGCGNRTSAYIKFDVIDCKGPAPSCINGITVTLMPQPEGGCAMATWASDFEASPIYDCTGQGPELNPLNPVQERVTKLAIYRQDDVENDPDFVPSAADTGLPLTEEDLGRTIVYVYGFDEDGNYDYCTTYVEVEAHVDCGGGASGGNLAGLVLTEEDVPVQDVEVNLNGGMTMAMVTPVDGHFEFSGLNFGMDYSLTPYHNADHSNGVTTFDIVKISQQILGVDPLDSPYQMIAADVNRSGAITTLDLIQIRKVILNINQEFDNNTSWRFVPADYVFPDPTNPWLEGFPEVFSVNDLAGSLDNANFIGVKIGDVNGSAAANDLDSDDRNLNGVFNFAVDNTSLVAGELYTVEFRGEDMASIAGYQGTLTLNGAELVDIEYGVATAENFGLRFADQGVLTTSWNGEAAAEDVLFSLVLRAAQDIELSKVLGVSSRYTVAEAYSETSTKNVGINFSNGVTVEAGFEVFQNTPNPFQAETLIGFNLPVDSEVMLTVSDVSGKVLTVLRGDYAAGYNTINLTKQQLGGVSGVLSYTLTAGEHTATKQMVVIE